MSFSEDCVQFGDQLAKLVDVGVAVREAAAALGVSQQRAYAILRATGRAMGSPNPDVSGVDRPRLVAVFSETGFGERGGQGARGGTFHGPPDAR